MLLYQFLNELLSNEVSVVVETNFHPELDSKKFKEIISKYDLNGVQIICYADGSCLYQRFIQRAKTSSRHIGHRDLESKEEFKDSLLKGKCEKLRVDFPAIEIDTTDWESVDFDNIVHAVKRAIG